MNQQNLLVATTKHGDPHETRQRSSNTQRVLGRSIRGRSKRHIPLVTASLGPYSRQTSLLGDQDRECYILCSDVTSGLRGPTFQQRRNWWAVHFDAAKTSGRKCLRVASASPWELWVHTDNLPSMHGNVPRNSLQGSRRSEQQDSIAEGPRYVEERGAHHQHLALFGSSVYVLVVARICSRLVPRKRRNSPR